MKTVRNIVLGLLLIPLAIDIYWKVGNSGTVADGEVTEKREAFEMPGGEAWRHVYEISYRYRPAGASYPTTGKDPVDASMYHRLRVGSRIPIRYKPQTFFGTPFGFQSHLDGSTFLSRMAFDSAFAPETAEILSMCVMAL